MSTCSRTLIGVGAFALAAGTSTMLIAAPASAAPSASDATFITANEQSNLAEIALGTLAKAKGQDAATRTMANKTYSDHVTAKGKLTAIGNAAKATLPSTPNAAQLAVAAQLKAVPATNFDLMYAQAQVAGHQLALAGARTELSTTKNAQLRSYATYYVGIATMHLNMAQAEVKALGGAPTSVPGGSGGAASTSSSLDATGLWAVGAGAVLVAAGATVIARRRSSAAQ
ncbi:DUF4142 domain-containing protein [uncultured Jatrophihabitans sp.]|uniref:DUF4142 domain-containing protein n=1 Tax=uncultured Jatrophihabitans sp. TaxID=1610747 RepID=UPI0035CA8270